MSSTSLPEKSKITTRIVESPNVRVRNSKSGDWLCCYWSSKKDEGIYSHDWMKNEMDASLIPLNEFCMYFPRIPEDCIVLKVEDWHHYNCLS